MKKYFFTILIISVILQNVVSQNKLSAIIPTPVSIETTNEEFNFGKNTKILTSNSELKSEITVFNSILNKRYNFTLSSVKKPSENEYIELILVKNLPKEAYQIKMNSRKITISGDKAGIFYGLISLTQMLPVKIENSTNLNCVNIYDYPRFSWRGMHLDVSRHFFPKEFIFKYLDYMSEYKMNTFHWHLTDDQGWRIEIKKYPLLTHVGAWRKGTLIGHSSDEEQIADSNKYGGFYTQDDIREVVAYAKSRHITIVPEIEMPGHAMAAISAYPYLSCNEKKVDVEKTWGVFDQVFCTKDTVFKFLEDVLLEVIDLFPDTYIHVGGDECPKINWKKCPVCQSRMKSEGLKNEEELQSYFIQRIGKFLSSHNRKIIGWDEILEGGLAEDAAIMSWRGTEGGFHAAKLKHNVVMTPNSFCYFDYYQGDPTNEPLAIGGFVPIEKVYSFEPIPDSLNDFEKKYILGAQANLWTEYIGNEQHVEYMILPRMCALSEVVWSPIEKRNYENFRHRLLQHFDSFDSRNINYSKSIFEIKKTVITDTVNQKLYFQLSQAFQMGDIFYHIEDNPNTASEDTKYSKPIEIQKSGTFFAKVIDKNGKIRGKAEQKFIISKSSGAKITLTYPPSTYYNYGGSFTLVDGISGRVPWNGKEWLGFSNTPMEAILDLGEIKEISEVTVHALKAEASWIYLPKKMMVEFSSDGITFITFGELNADSINKIGRIMTIKSVPFFARYIKIHIERAGIIESGKPGEGNNAWLFVSEIEIN